jgi:O-antigen/teichoic acid export membrane protein
VTVPILLSRWGNALYGEWLTLTTVVGSLSLLNLGVQSHVGNILITHYVRGEPEASADLFASTLRLYALLSGTALIVTLGLAASPRIGEALGLSMIPVRQARIIILIQGCLAAYAIVGGLLMSLFRVTGQLPRQLAWGIAEKIGFLFVPIGVAVGGGGPLAASVGVAVAVFGIVALELRDVFQRTPFTFSWGRGRWGTAFSLLPPSLEFFAVSGIPALLPPGVVLLLSRSPGAGAVATFFTALMTVNFARTLMSQLLVVLWPEIRSSYASGTGKTSLSTWLAVTQKGSFVFSAAVGLGIALLGPDVIARWTGGRIDVDTGLCGLLALLLLGQTPGMVYGVFGLALGLQRDVLVGQVVTVVGSLLAAATLLSPFGVKGVAAGLAGGHMAGTVSLWLLSRRWPVKVTGESASGTVARMAAVVGASVIVVTIIEFWAPRLGIRLLSTGIGVAALLGFGWQWSLTSEERSYVVRVGKYGARRLRSPG